MAATIITIAQQKGGSGKTTLAVQLAVCWAGDGKKVAIVDIDPQASVSAWHSVRCRTLDDASGGGIHLSTISGWRLGTELDRLRREFDVVVVDSPPHAESEARAAVRAADLVLLPVQPSPMDIWAIAPTIAVAQKERRAFLVVLNRMPSRSRLSDQVLHDLSEQKLPVALASLGNRQVFAASMMEGRGVTEVAPRTPAADEIRALATEALARVVAATA